MAWQGPIPLVGRQGSPGLQGEPGEDAVSIPGLPGIAGATGPQGASGSPGPQGDPGEDAVPIPGPTGVQGPQGTQGLQGPPGLHGEDYSEDRIVVPGPVGPAGANGVNGTQGVVGPAGLDGEPGEDAPWLFPPQITTLPFSSIIGTLSAAQFPALLGNVTTTAGSLTTTLASVPSGFLRGYLDGMTLSNDGTNPNGALDVAVGVCRDVTDSISIVLPATVKGTGGTFVAGSGNFGLDTGTVAASTWYHVFAIAQTGGVSPDVLFSTSATTPTMPATYTLKRRIGSFRTDASSHIVAFHQYGDEFYWDTPVNDVNAANPGITAVTRTLSVPTGVKVKVMLLVTGQGTPSADQPLGVYVSSLDAVDVTASFAAASLEVFIGITASPLVLGAQSSCWTNTSAQVRTRLQQSGATTNLYLTTLGWTDLRGRNN